MNWLKGAALVALTALCVALTLAVYSLNSHLGTTFQKLDNEIDGAHRLTLEAGLTAMEARKASVKESAYLDQWNMQVSATVQDVQSVLKQTQATIQTIQETSEAATGAIKSTQETVAALQGPITQTANTLQALQPLIQHADTLVSDPAIPKTIANVQSTTSHLDATAADVQQTVYKYTHPGIWAKVKSWTLDIAHIFNPL